MSSKLAVIANLRALPVAKKVALGVGGLGAAGLGIKNYMDSVETPPSDELLMMDLSPVPEDKFAALVNDIPAANTAMRPAPTPSVPTPPIGMDSRDMYGTKSTNPTPYLSSGAASGESSNPRSEAISATGNKATSSGRGGVKNAAFLEGGLLPAAAGGIGGYLLGEHLIAPHFARQQVAIAEQIAQGQAAMAGAARNQRISPILAAAAGALFLTWLLSHTNKKRELHEGLGGPGSYAGGLQGFNPEDRQGFSTDNRLPHSRDPHILGY